MLRLGLCVPVINHREETLAWLESFRSTASDWPSIELLIIDNGSTVPVLEWGLPGVADSQVVTNRDNTGVLPALQQAYELLKEKCDYILYTHNDVTMFEQGWDTKLKEVLGGVSAGHPKGVGVAGFYGAKGIGTSDLYRIPYQMHQLVRVENVSSCSRMPSAHGFRAVRPPEVWETIAVMDGFSLCVSVQFLRENGGFDPNLPPHHMYDNHTCLQAIDLGYLNIVVAMDAFHHGGVTDVSEDWEKPFGKSKSEIHQDAHYPYFYHYWNAQGAAERKQHGRIGITLPYMTN